MDKKETKLTATEIVAKLKNNDFKMLFFTVDTKGNPLGSVAHIYETVKILNDLGYNATILHEKPIGLNDENGMNIGYTPVGGWLGQEYDELPHQAIEGKEFRVNPSDFIIIPEVFSNVMDSLKAFPSKQIILLQAYEYIFELLAMGMSWSRHYNIKDVIATSPKLAEYAKSLFPAINTHVVPVSIPDYFTPSEMPKKPTITILTREQADAAKIVKSFYAQYPTFKWITFRELRGIPKRNFSEALKESCLSVWVDDRAGFGTFPLESIECNTPVIGRIPNFPPEWMVDRLDENGNAILNDSGLWVNSSLDIPKLIAEYMQVWLEDSVPENLTEVGLDKHKGQYTLEKTKEAIENVYGQIINERIAEFEAIVAKELEEKKDK